MIKKFIPSRLKAKLRKVAKKHYKFLEKDEWLRIFEKETMERRMRIDRGIPSIDLDQKHINNLKMLLNRHCLLELLPNNSICAEIGVNKGEFSVDILNVTKPAKLHLIDAWADEKRYHDGLRLEVEEKFANEISAGIVEINKGFSTEVLKLFPDNYFDWVYLDTDHTYKLTTDELKVLKDKVKGDGIIAGHDYILGNWSGDCRYGVIEAVHELCVNDNWELLYLTINKNEMPSFAIKKII